MRMLSLISTLLVVGSAAATAWAADLAKIDRTIVKEPAYEGKPRYCLLVFGLEAKSRVWLVKDESTLFIDRTGNGEWTPGDIVGPDGKSRYKVTLRRYPKGLTLSVFQNGHLRHVVGDADTDPLVFGERPSEAPVVHIGGPLTVNLNHYGSLYLQVLVGTPGLGKGTFAASVLRDVNPVAHVEFPCKKPGAPPIVTQTTLKDR